MKPQEIEAASMAIIDKRLRDLGLQDQEMLCSELGKKLVKRAIHASADFDFARILTASDSALEIMQEALRNHVSVVVDTNMIKAGVSKPVLEKLGCTLSCYMSDEEVIVQARERDCTRAWVSMEKALRVHHRPLIVVGNAPTALLSLCEQLENKEVEKPCAVIGVPVGFVQVEESKERLMESGIPYLVSRGLKGGSTIAVALLNALLYSIYRPD